MRLKKATFAWLLLFSVYLPILLGSSVVHAAKDSDQQFAPPSVILVFMPSYIGPGSGSELVMKVRELLGSELEAKGHQVFFSGIIPKDPAQVRKALSEKGVDYGIYGTISRLGDVVSLDFNISSRASNEVKPLVAFVQGPEDKLRNLVKLLAIKINDDFSIPMRIADVSVEGNKRVGTDAILANVKTQKGQLYDPSTIAEDIKSIYKMGYFDDVEVDVQDSSQGKVVTFLVREKPAIRKIIFQGNKEIGDDKIRDVLDLKPYTVIKDKSLQENAEKIKALYAEKGYAGTTVAVSVRPVSNQAADVIFEITEGEKVHIKSIKIEGVKAFSQDELKSIMEVTEKKPWWTPSIRNIVGLVRGSAGILKWDALERDVGRLTAFYHNHGYVDAKVGKPKVERKGAEIYVTIPVHEGQRYGVGKIDIEQDLFNDEHELLSHLEIKNMSYFSQEVLRKDIMSLTNMYSDKGYAHCTINPRIIKDPEKKVVNITLVVNKGPKVYFNRINIAGNTRTRDKVIRRELRVMELKPFSATGLKTSNDRLRRLGYFEDVEITPKPAQDESHMNLDVKVKERPTGTFSIGAGYSSVDNLILMGEISQRNFLGKGQTLSFKGIIGGSTQRFSLSFFEPYFQDTRLSLGMDLYNWQYDYSDYTKDSVGGALRFGYPLTDNLSFYFGGRIDNTDLSDIDDNASYIIQESVDIKSTRSLSGGLTYDTRDRYFNPTRGFKSDFSIEYAGGILGGDASFLKFRGEVGYYHPIWRFFVAHLRLGAGYVIDGPGGKLPVYERFFLGGLDSIRGYKYGDVSPRDPDTDERIGGEYMGFVQSEVVFPLLKEMGLNGVIFLDVGNVWGKDTDEGFDITDLRKSAGAGIRWLSPMGPLRVEWGYNFDRKPGDDKSNWEFRMGGNF